MTIQIEISEQDLPVLSVVAAEALDLLQNPNLTHQKLEDVIRRDPAMTSRLLHIANSPFYATRVDSKSIADAARKLGMRQLNNIVTAAATGELFDASDSAAQGLWEHSQMVATASQAMAEKLELPGTDEAYVAGLLHDIGKIIIYRQHPQVYSEMLQQARATNRPINELETESFKFFNHMSIGGLVVRKWRLSESIAESARFHHDLLRLVPREMSNPSIACIVALANIVVNSLQNAGSLPDSAQVETLACSQKLNLTRDRIGKLFELLQARVFSMTA